MKAHRENVNLELVFLLLGVEPLKCIHKRWVALAIKSVGAGMMKAGEQEKVKMKMSRQTEEIGRKVMFGNLEEVRPGEHEWGSELAF